MFNVGTKVLIKETGKVKTFPGLIIGERVRSEYDVRQGELVWEVLIDFENQHGRKFVYSSFFKDSNCMHAFCDRFRLEENPETDNSWINWLTENYDYSGKGKGDEMWEETFWLSKNPTDFNIYSESNLREQYLQSLSKAD